MICCVHFEVYAETHVAGLQVNSVTLLSTFKFGIIPPIAWCKYAAHFPNLHAALGPENSRYMRFVFNYDEYAVLRSQLISISSVTTQGTGNAISIPGIANILYLPWSTQIDSGVH